MLRFAAGATLLAAVFFLGFADPALAQTTAFSYQGRLTDAGNPATGSFDLQFKMFDTSAPGTGTQQGPTVLKSAVAVTAGVFTVDIDVGSSPFSGAERYLEIGVKPAGNGGAYTLLSPRQHITSSPYAIQTLNAQQLGGLPASRYLSTDDSGNVGIGTLKAPVSKLEIIGQDGLSITGYQPFLTFWDSNSGYLRGRLQSSDGGFNFFPASYIGGFPAAVIKNNGYMGIGSVAPAHRFELSGGPFWTANGWYGAMSLANVSAIGWHPNVGGKSFGMGQTNGGFYFFNSASPPGTGASAANYIMQFTDTGHVVQPITSNGLLKAAIEVTSGGNIYNCYNGVTGATIASGNCGFTVTSIGGVINGIKRINFGFYIRNRFFGVTGYYVDAGLTRMTHANYRVYDDTSVEVFTSSTLTNASDTSSERFTLLMY